MELSTFIAVLLSLMPMMGSSHAIHDHGIMSHHAEKYQTVPTKFVSVNGTNVAYRRFGKSSKIPVVYLNHLRGAMDVLDPRFFNTIAENRECVVFDSFGIGHSEGDVPSSVEEMGEIAASFISELGIHKADILGFSIGGMVAQYVALTHPDKLNKLILAGTQPSGNDPAALAERTTIQRALAVDIITSENMVPLFFESSETSTQAGKEWFQRLQERQVDGEERKGFLRGAGVAAQGAALSKWTASSNWFERLGDIKVPVLVTNGHNDSMTPTPNSFLLQQELPNAELHIYPDSGHGHLFQYPQKFSQQLEWFLKEGSNG